MPDHIDLRLPPLPCRIGVLEGENDRPQPVVVGVRLDVDLERAGRSGRLEDTVDYAAVHEVVCRAVLARRWTLVESLAHCIVLDTLAVDPRILGVTVTVEKCEPPLGDAAGPVKIHLSRTREAIA
jgi:7,8-dihydroneopterin aldolase/epimerase/oxygenase